MSAKLPGMGGLEKERLHGEKRRRILKSNRTQTFLAASFIRQLALYAIPVDMAFDPQSQVFECPDDPPCIQVSVDCSGAGTL